MLWNLMDFVSLSPTRGKLVKLFQSFELLKQVHPEKWLYFGLKMHPNNETWSSIDKGA